MAATAGVEGSVMTSGAPCFKLMASTYSINDKTSDDGRYSVRYPPNSAVMLNFPSLKLPAPPAPLMTPHAGQQLAYVLILFAGGHLSIRPSIIGQCLYFASTPLSIISTFAWGAFSANSYAA